ncbi:STING domain-containing protein [Haloferula chungangensis]|uniref:STING domain-containing protein n=1 Tax=Haloferula chungangensis TaxID=1048331 RepID=A0ABW2L672_9BACT
MAKSASSPVPPPAPAPADGWLRWFAEIWNDYPWISRVATVSLVMTSLLDIFQNATGPDGWLAWLPENLLATITSGGMNTLLTLLVALGIGLHLKKRQLRGLLDGTEHYDIGRALAFGYFSNFLVAALILVRMESRKRGRPLVFRVVCPSNIRELEDFKTVVEPQIRQWAGKRELEGIYKSGASVIKRSILIISRVTGPQSEEDLYFDFPTTLYTLHDYYESWNMWLEENGKAPLAEIVIERMQEQQVTAFERHLHGLFHSTTGLAAVRHLGIHQLEDLSSLYDEHFRRVSPAAMLDLVRER